MELKDINNRQTLKEYLLEKRRFLNSFEDFILRNLYIYFQERQCFFLQKDCFFKNTIEDLKEKYKNFIPLHYNISDFYTLSCNNSGEFWVKTNEVIGWNFENKTEWKPVFGEKWNLFDIIFRVNRDYILLHEDEHVKIVILLSYLEENLFTITSNQRLLYEIGFVPSPFKNCDLFKEVLTDCSYTFQTNQETYSFLGVEEYFRMRNYYQEQNLLLKRNLQANRISL